MKLVADSGVWTVGPAVSAVPALAVLEVSGAVLEWTVDDPAGPEATRLTVTDVGAADWLWRVVGATGHAAIVAALSDGPSGNGVGSRDVELSDVALLPEALAPLRRLAVGYWLRRWWPESSRDGIVRLDRALLDAELAVLVSAAGEFFTEDTLDSDVESLLSPHRAALLALEGEGDPRVAGIVGASVELADELGVWEATQPVAPAGGGLARRDDYALAAGGRDAGRVGAVARGVDSVDWVAVPPGVFDAAEGTVGWAVESADAAVLAMVRVATTGERVTTGIEVRLRSGALTAAGVLDPNGAAALTVVGPDGILVTGTQAWDHDWSDTAVRVGAAPPGDEPTNDQAAQAIRQRMRDLARRRLTGPGPDAFLAEIVAAESDY